MSEQRCSGSEMLPKQVFRKQMKQILAKIKSDQVLTESAIVTEKIYQSKILENAKRISIYVSTTNEIMTEKLIEHCLSAQKHVYIPRFKKNDNYMEMLRLSSLEEYHSLEIIMWGIRQHTLNAQATSLENDELADKSAPTGLDLIFMPGAAFTERGDRLGHGKGFYDRFLHEHYQRNGRMPLKIGLALKAQILETLPMVSGQDVQLDYVFHA